MTEPMMVPTLKEGEYDLVNISVLGFDPVTGRSYAECSAEFRKWLDVVEAESIAVRWWQLRRRWRLAIALLHLKECRRLQ